MKSIKHFLYNLMKIIPDKFYLQIIFRIRLKEKLNIEHPITFNEKLQWLKLHDRNPLYTCMVDKYEAKKYVASIIGQEFIIPTIGIYDKFEDIDFNQLPNQFVIKCTHDSGGIFICKNKNNISVKKIKKIINKSLKYNFFWGGREWPYKNIKPRIIIEKYMVNEDNRELCDYKLMCFNGKVLYSFVCTNRFSGNNLNVTFYDRNWNKMEFERHYHKDDGYIKKPHQYENMVKLAEILSINIPFVRVDFYECNKKVYFGELTFYPGSGMEEFNPKEWDIKLGNLLKIKE